MNIIDEYVANGDLFHAQMAELTRNVGNTLDEIVKRSVNKVGEQCNKKCLRVSFLSTVPDPEQHTFAVYELTFTPNDNPIDSKIFVVGIVPENSEGNFIQVYERNRSGRISMGKTPDEALKEPVEILGKLGAFGTVFQRPSYRPGQAANPTTPGGPH